MGNDGSGAFRYDIPRMPVVEGATEMGAATARTVRELGELGDEVLTAT